MPRNQRHSSKRNPKKHFKNAKDPSKNRFSKGPRQYHYQEQLQEVDVGIKKFISDLPGFSAIIKARYSDFQVNEVNLDGEVAKLTDLSIPADFQKKEPSSEEGECVESPLDAIPQATWDEIKAMLNSTEETTVELEATNLTREERAKVHECTKRAFGKKLCAQTVTKDDKKVMVFKKHDPKTKDDRFKWPEDKGEYVYFLVYKECVDTLEACLKIASSLRISPSNFNYAGVKDKRGKTTQWFSVRKVEPWKLIMKTKQLLHIKIGNVTFKDKPLKLGQLQGNKFRIALRNVMGDDELIEKSLESLKTKGFINYYGLQRFGHDKEVPTFAIGLQLLLGNWKEACNLILKPTKGSDPEFDVSKAKTVYQETGDAGKALEQFEGSKNSCTEYLLLSGLNKEQSNDFVNALANIPRNTRLLYIHSFQSLVWNLAASERIEKFGLKVVEGDLVILDGCIDECDKEDDETSDSSKKVQVKVLSSNECDNYSIYDIVLPLPGYDIVYPENVKDFYKATLEKHGLSLEMTKQRVQTYNLSGTYRKLLGQVTDLNWKILYYSDPNYNLIRSDYEELRNYEEPKSVPDGKYKALVLELFLNSSCYATMFLREILKMDTSSSSHAKLNNYHVSTEETGSKTEVPENDAKSNDFAGEKSLLDDPLKYSMFKNIVFGVDEETPLKRKHEDGLEDSENAKIAKTDVDEVL